MRRVDRLSIRSGRGDAAAAAAADSVNMRRTGDRIICASNTSSHDIKQFVQRPGSNVGRIVIGLRRREAIAHSSFLSVFQKRVNKLFFINFSQKIMRHMIAKNYV